MKKSLKSKRAIANSNKIMAYGTFEGGCFGSSCYPNVCKTNPCSK